MCHRRNGARGQTNLRIREQQVRTAIRSAVSGILLLARHLHIFKHGKLVNHTVRRNDIFKMGLRHIEYDKLTM